MNSTRNAAALERLKQRVEQRVRELFLPRLLEAGVKYHTRRGIRKDCRCSFCLAKLCATYRIGSIRLDLAGEIQARKTRGLWWNDDEDYLVQKLILTEREKRKREVRKELQKRRNEIL